MEKKESKYVSLNHDEYFLLGKCSTFALAVFNSVAKIHVDFAKITSEYVSLAIALKSKQIEMSGDVLRIYQLKEEYFDVSIRVITLTLAHLSERRYRDYVFALYRLKNKIKKEGK